MSFHEIPVAVKSAAGGYTAVGAIGTFVVSLIGLVVAWVKFGPKWKEVAVSAEKGFRDDLLARVDHLEAALEKERSDRAAERAKHEAERASERHRINNMQACFDALLMLIEQDPAKAADAAAKVKAMRSEQMKAEAIEKSAIHAAAIAGKATP